MSVLASALDIGDTQARLNVPLSGVGSGGFNVKIDDELLHVGGVENRTGLVLAMSYAATESHAQGATVTPVLDAFTTDTSSPFATGGGGGFDEDSLEFYEGASTIEIRTGLASQLRLRQRDGDGDVRSELIFDDASGRIDANTYDATGAPIATWEVGEDGFGGSVLDELGQVRAVFLAEAGASVDADGKWEWAVKDAAGVDKAKLNLSETGTNIEGPVNLNLPTSNPGPGILWNDTGTVKVGT